MVTVQKQSTYLSEAQVRFLKQQAERLGGEAAWAPEIERRRAVAAKYQALVESSEILRGGELSRDQLAEMVLCVREIQKLNRIVLPQILGTYTWYRYFKGFEGSREAFAAHMADKRADWAEGSFGYEGLDMAALSRDLAAAFAAPKGELGPAYARLIEYSGVGRGLATAFLLLWEPRRHAVINALPPGLFRAKRGPLTIDKGTRDRVRAQARREYGLEGRSHTTSVANTFAWTILLGEVRDVCGFEDFLEVDLLLGRIANEAGEGTGEKEVSEPSDIERAIEAGLAQLTPERLATRQQAIEDAHALIAGHLGRLGEAELRELIKLFNTDFYDGRTTSNRFSPAFAGRFLHDLAARVGEANDWIQRLWEAETPAEVEAVLDEFWEEVPLPGAGSSFPTLVLHAKDPGRFPPHMSGLARGYERLTSEPAHKRKGAVYLQYAEGIRALCEAHNISPHAVDLVLLEASSETSAGVDHDREETSDRGGYGRESFLEETLLDEYWLEEVEALLSEKPQLVFYGPPGTGKTWVAERLARYLTRRGGEVAVVQFHPSYSYEDFIEGIRPALDEATGQVTYRVEPGLFRRFCEEASGRQDETFVLVIDEINRGNLPKVFGELLFLLERRGAEGRVELPISRTAFSIPENVRVLGTMNTADQAIALVDVALRRRFHFVPLRPDSELLRRYLDQSAPAMSGLAELLERLNEKLRREGMDENLFIGHSHFMKPTLDEAGARRAWEHSIMPTLEEFFYGKPDRLARFSYEEFAAPFLSQAADEEGVLGDEEDDD